MTPHETLVALIKSKVPRLQGWEIEGLAKRLEGAGDGKESPKWKPLYKAIGRDENGDVLIGPTQ